jgi:hypothetical protein
MPHRLRHPLPRTTYSSEMSDCHSGGSFHAMCHRGDVAHLHGEMLDRGDGFFYAQHQTSRIHMSASVCRQAA